MEFIEFQDQKIAFTDNGQKGTPVVFIHGYCEDLSMWDEFCEPFEEDYRLIKIDLPGFGKSEIKGKVSIAEMAEVVITVLRHLDIKKYIYISHSMGGYVGLELAKTEGKNLLGFGLFHSHPFADSEATKKKRHKGVEFIEQNGSALYAKQLIPLLFKKDFHKSNHYLVAKLVYQASKSPKEGFINGQIAMSERVDNTAILKELECPVLMIIGKQEQTAPYDLVVKQVDMPSLGSVHILEKVGHMGMFSAKKETQKIVEDFLGFCALRLRSGLQG